MRKLEMVEQRLSSPLYQDALYEPKWFLQVKNSVIEHFSLTIVPAAMIICLRESEM